MARERAWPIPLCERLTLGDLTRRLVDVSQEVIIREDDCGATKGLEVFDIREGKESIEPLSERLIGRYLVHDFVDELTGEVLVSKDKLMDDDDAEIIVSRGVRFTLRFARSWIAVQNMVFAKSAMAQIWPSRNAGQRWRGSWYYCCSVHR